MVSAKVAAPSCRLLGRARQAKPRARGHTETASQHVPPHVWLRVRFIQYNNRGLDRLPELLVSQYHGKAPVELERTPQIIMIPGATPVQPKHADAQFFVQLSHLGDAGTIAFRIDDLYHFTLSVRHQRLVATAHPMQGSTAMVEGSKERWTRRYHERSSRLQGTLLAQRV